MKIHIVYCLAAHTPGTHGRKNQRSNGNGAREITTLGVEEGGRELFDTLGDHFRSQLDPDVLGLPILCEKRIKFKPIWQ